MRDVVRGWGAKEDAKVSNGSSRGEFGFRMRGTLDGVEKQIPIPYRVNLPVYRSVNHKT